jgi:hypothetical protein
MKKLLSVAAAAAIMSGVPTAYAAQLDVEITNLTNGIWFTPWFTPFLVAAHPDGSEIFTAGQPASANLQAMAEGGDISGLSADLNGVGATIVENPASGLLPPGMSAIANLDTDGTSNVRLTVVSMLLPTNEPNRGPMSTSCPLMTPAPRPTTNSSPAVAPRAQQEYLPIRADLPVPAAPVRRPLTPIPMCIFTAIRWATPILVAVPATWTVACIAG